MFVPDEQAIWLLQQARAQLLAQPKAAIAGQNEPAPFQGDTVLAAVKDALRPCAVGLRPIPCASLICLFTTFSRTARALICALAASVVPGAT